jgi:hypothetical protein
MNWSYFFLVKAECSELYVPRVLENLNLDGDNPSSKNTCLTKVYIGMKLYNI